MGIVFIIFAILIASVSILGIVKKSANNIFPITGILVSVILGIFGCLML